MVERRSNGVLQQDADALATPGAGGSDCKLALQAAERARGSDRQPHTRSGQGVTNGDRPPVNIDSVAVQSELLFDGQVLRAERLVDLEARDIVSLEPALPQQRADGWRGTDAHHLGWHADDRARNDARERLQAVGAHEFARCDQGCRRTVDDGRAIAAGLYAVLTEGRAKLTQHLQRARANVLVAIEALDLPRQRDATRSIALERPLL